MTSTLAPTHPVLVIDDDDAIREAMVAVLEVSGYAAAAARSVDDAYHLVRRGLRPCLVLLDLHMPVASGWTFLDRRESEPNVRAIPVVVVSGDHDQRWAVMRAGHDFMGKPVGPHALVAMVGRHCPRHFP